ncbi:MAG: Arc family DNA-binding protein [Taibaiella sp.]|nr:Arc family DNA-binding protein [Taibaiella sp.]
MADKKNFVLRLNAAMYKALEKWAADDFRSVNGQIEYLLNNALKEQGRLPKPEQKPAGKKED